MSLIELGGVLFSIAYLLLAAKENFWCWPAAIISNLIYLWVFFSAKLYPESGLQIFYLFFSVKGWMLWKKNNPSETLSISRMSLQQHGLLIGMGTVFSVLGAYLFQQYTDAALPWLDTPIAVFSVLTTWLVVQKKIENWWYWVLIDSAAIYLYIQRELFLTALLFAIYVILAVWGYFEWKKKMKIN
jgi:nicotinamide mononucleotide transporter